MQGGSYRGAQLQGASLQGVLLQGADFTGAQLPGVSFLKAKMQGATLEAANLQGASFSDAQMQGVDLDRADLRGAYLYQSILRGASLQEAVLQGASLELAQTWRAYGSPFAVLDLVDLTKIDPRTNSWTSIEPEAGHKDFLNWRDNVLANVPSGRARNDAVDRLSVLDPVLKIAPKSAISAEGWEAISSRQPTGEERGRKLAEFLVDLACSGDAAPFVARGLLQNRSLDAAFGALIGPVAAGLRKGRFDQAACPGVKGFSDADWAYLDGIAGPAPKPAPPTKP